jgi:tetratricopeptide (TPR) repeat protein
MGRDAERVGNYQAMLGFCREASEIPNPDPAAFLCVGDAYMYLGNRDLAEQYWLNYLDRRPDDVLARMKLIEFYITSGRHLAARTHVERVLQFDANNFTAYYYLGEIERISGNCDPGYRAYQRALQINPAFNPAIAGMERLKREVCRGRSYVPSQTYIPSAPVRKEKTFQGGGKALKEGQW